MLLLCLTFSDCLCFMLSTKFYFEIGISLGLERLVSEQTLQQKPFPSGVSGRDSDYKLV